MRNAKAYSYLSILLFSERGDVDRIESVATFLGLKPQLLDRDGRVCPGPAQSTLGAPPSHAHSPVPLLCRGPTRTAHGDRCEQTPLHGRLTCGSGNARRRSLDEQKKSLCDMPLVTWSKKGKLCRARIASARMRFRTQRRIPPAEEK